MHMKLSISSVLVMSTEWRLYFFLLGLMCRIILNSRRSRPITSILAHQKYFCIARSQSIYNPSLISCQLSRCGSNFLYYCLYLLLPGWWSRLRNAAFLDHCFIFKNDGHGNAAKTYTLTANLIAGLPPHVHKFRDPPIADDRSHVDRCINCVRDYCARRPGGGRALKSCVNVLPFVVYLFHLLKVIIGPLAIADILPHQGTGRNSLTTRPGDVTSIYHETVFYEIHTSCIGRREAKYDVITMLIYMMSCRVFTLQRPMTVDS